MLRKHRKPNAESEPPTRGSVFALIGVSTFWWLIAGYFAMGGVIGCQRMRAAESAYAETDATVIKSEVKSEWDRDGSSHSADFVYRYEVENKTYENDGVHATPWQNRDLAWVKNFVNKRPVGKRIRIYYDPNNPTQSVVFRNSSTTDWLLIVVLELATLVPGIYLLWQVAKQFKRYRAVAAI